MSYDYNLVALAGAVLILGLVVVLELRSVVQLRRTVEKDLGRVFEQLDQLCFESQQLVEGQQRQVRRVANSPAPVVAAALAPAAQASVLPFTPAPGRLAAGEARVLAALQNAKGR